MARIAIIMAAFALAWATVTPSLAAKPVREDSITLVGTAYLGSTVSFSYTLAKHVKDPRIQVVCSQGEDVVWAAAQPAPGNSFLLGGLESDWLDNGGSASCVATLYRWQFHPSETMIVYASITFTAAAGAPTP